MADLPELRKRLDGTNKSTGGKRPSSTEGSFSRVNSANERWLQTQSPHSGRARGDYGQAGSPPHAPRALRERIASTADWEQTNAYIETPSALGAFHHIFDFEIRATATCGFIGERPKT